MAQILVPYALDWRGELVAAGDAERGGAFTCPSCLQPVYLRKGQVRVPHFAHSAYASCSTETVVHQTAKLLVRRVVRRWRQGVGTPPVIVAPCVICEKKRPFRLTEEAEDALIEHRLLEGFVADVALVAKDRALLAVEILVTHAVDDRKEELLRTPFIEIKGEDVLSEPAVWKPVKSGKLDFTCSGCRARIDEYRERVRRVAEETGVGLPARYYRFGLHVCWRCKREILVFAWPGFAVWSSRPPRYEPRPGTITYRYSQGAGEHCWVNTCPYCGKTQGAFFLLAEPDGPFFGMVEIEDSDAAFHRDQVRIAAWYLAQHAAQLSGRQSASDRSPKRLQR